jgi:hypothetical protein
MIILIMSVSYALIYILMNKENQGDGRFGHAQVMIGFARYLLAALHAGELVVGKVGVPGANV